MYEKIRLFSFRNKIFLFIVLIVLFFFWPVFKGDIPFPGDTLVGFYEPYKAYPILGFSPGSVPNKAQGPDVIKELFPWKNFVIESLRQGQVPFWNPYNFSGNPLMANFQSGTFYPPNVIFLIFPFTISWTIFILLIPILASSFTYLFLRELNLSKTSSFFGGIVFAFSSYMVVWLQYGNIGHTLLWIPLGLLITEKLIKKFEWKFLFFLTLILWFSILAGYIQGYFYSASLIFAYFLFKGFTEGKINLRRFLYFITALISPVALSLFQILPTIELFNASSRSDYTLSQIQNLLNPWWYAITAIAPNFFGNPATFNHWFWGTYIERVSYIGLVPFILFLSAVLSFKRRKEKLFFGVVAILSFIISLDLFITKYFFKIPVPIISTAVPTRILSLFQFSAAILSAFGLEYFLKNQGKRKFYIATFITLFLIGLSWMLAFFGGEIFQIDPVNLSISKKNLIIPTFLAIAFLLVIYIWFKTKSKLTIFAILLLTIFDLFYFFQRITPFSPPEFTYPETPVVRYLKENGSINRFWGYGSGYIESNFQLMDKTFSPEGNDPLHIRTYTELLSSSKNGKLSENLPRPDANIERGFGEKNLRENKYRQRLLNLLGAKYVLHKTGSDSPDYTTFPDRIYRLVQSDGYYQIYENKEVLPRFFLTGDYTVEDDEGKIISLIYDEDIDLKKTLILKEDPKINIDKNSKGVAQLINYLPNKVSVKTKSNGNSLLFISDTYYPGWEVKIDNTPSQIILSDYAFRAVPVEEGEHIVEFLYRPKSFYKGLTLSLFSLIILALFLSYVRNLEKKL